MAKEEYRQLIKAKGHLPTGILGQDFPVDFIVKFLEDNLALGESLLDVVGVRFQGKNTFLVLTSKRLICVSIKPHTILGKNFELPLTLNYNQIEKIFIAPKSGVLVKGKSTEFSMYFVQLKEVQNFSEPLEKLGIKVETLTAIPSDKHEKRIMLQGTAVVIIIVVLFGSCIYRSITSPEPVNPGASSEEIEACLRRYIQGSTVEPHEIEEGRRRCAPR
ncbi:MAG: hypothetical protein SFY66_10705 [Oculatellaceae cyanobacterium bins.114]|nr:hypothetical protein [Oculatellaceae cyanobacterium bins.114]